MTSARFDDRRAAGRALAEHLAELDLAESVVLALPRGGVPVGREVADRLGAPLDVYVTRKIGAPHQPELAVGAVAEGGTVVIDERTRYALDLDEDLMAELTRRAEVEVAAQVARYRGARPLPSLRGRTAIVVDDGLATGLTADAAVRGVRDLGAQRVVLAAPVGSAQAIRALTDVADAVEVVLVPARLGSVGQWYVDFGQVVDDEVIAALGGTA